MGDQQISSFQDGDKIVSAEWLQAHLDDPQVVIVDCRFSLADPEAGRRQYEAGHLPGAVYLDLDHDLSKPTNQRLGPHGGRHPLPETEALAERLRQIGVMSGPTPSWVVAYDDSRLGFAARLWWLLRYLGHDQVSVLDGGVQGWLAQGYSLTKAPPSPRTGNFSPQERSHWVVDIATVEARTGLPGVVLVDSREADRYRGDREPIDPVAGHIPGAVNYPWMDVTDERGYVRPTAEQQQRWAEVQTADEILVYCGSGVTACVNLLSLAIAGIDRWKLYAGSWSDWCSYPNRVKD